MKWRGDTNTELPCKAFKDAAFPLDAQRLCGYPLTLGHESRTSASDRWMFLSLNVLEDCQPSISVEEVHIVCVDIQRDVLAGMHPGTRINAGYQRLSLGRHVH